MPCPTRTGQVVVCSEMLPNRFPFPENLTSGVSDRLNMVGSLGSNGLHRSVIASLFRFSTIRFTTQGAEGQCGFGCCRNILAGNSPACRPMPVKLHDNTIGTQFCKRFRIDMAFLKGLPEIEFRTAEPSFKCRKCFSGRKCESTQCRRRTYVPLTRFDDFLPPAEGDGVSIRSHRPSRMHSSAIIRCNSGR